LKQQRAQSVARFYGTVNRSALAGLTEMRLAFPRNILSLLRPEVLRQEPQDNHGIPAMCGQAGMLYYSDRKKGGTTEEPAPEEIKLAANGWISS